VEKLEEYGLVSKRAYQDNPPRYEYALTEKGADFLPVLQAFAAWSAKHIFGRWPSPPWFTEGKPEQFYPVPAAGRAVTADGGNRNTRVAQAQRKLRRPRWLRSAAVARRRQP
jgi:hypothetical protein